MNDRRRKNNEWRLPRTLFDLQRLYMKKHAYVEMPTVHPLHSVGFDKECRKLRGETAAAAATELRHNVFTTSPLDCCTSGCGGGNKWFLAKQLLKEGPATAAVHSFVVMIIL